MKLTNKEKQYLSTLLGHEVDHYTQSLNEVKEQLLYEDRCEVVKELIKSQNFYERCIKEAKKIQGKLSIK